MDAKNTLPGVTLGNRRAVVANCPFLPGPAGQIAMPKRAWFRRATGKKPGINLAKKIRAAKPPAIHLMKLNTLNDLYIYELKDLYSAEKQILQALPQMAKAASSGELKAAFEAHLTETKEHVNRLEQVLELAGAGTRGPKCKGMEGLIEEGKTMIAEEADAEVRDAGLISAAQRVEHYEMAGYGCVRTYAQLLGLKEATEILQTTLDEEGATDKKLSQLAESVINVRAIQD